MIEVFTIPITTGANRGKLLAYAPLKKRVKLIDVLSEVDDFRKEIAEVPDSQVFHISPEPDSFRTLMLLPNNKCNFRDTCKLPWHNVT